VGRFAELLAHDGVEEDLVLRGPVGFMAFHGGSLEVGTDTIAAAAAEASDASFYAVRQPIGLRWHIPSREVTSDDSPALARFLAHVHVVIAVHGYGRVGRWTHLLLGGSNRALATHLAGHLRHGMPGYTVVDDLAEVPPELRGVHPDNPVNRCAGGGVQLELPPRTRTRVPVWDHLPEGAAIPHAVDLAAALATAARSWRLPADHPRVEGQGLRRTMRQPDGASGSRS
jgi:phage replication-related protein YjqB (UPF0714/DUF867 family)